VQPPTPKGTFDTVKVNGAEVRVYTLGIVHMVDEQITADITKVMGALLSMDWRAVIATADPAGTALRTLYPLVGPSVLRVVDACCVPSLQEAGADIAVTMEAVLKWARLSFVGEQRLKNLVAAVEAIAAELSPTDPQKRSIGASRPSLPQDIGSPTSTTVNGRTEPLTPG
jgi:hypothetical protein